MHDPGLLFQNLLNNKFIPIDDETIDLCRLEGLLPLLAVRSGEVSEEYADRFRVVTYQCVANETARRRVVRAVLDTLHDASIEALVFKGGALAYLCYEQPWYRSRNDTDLLVREEDRDRAMTCLLAGGFTREESLPGDLAMGEASFDLTDEFGLRHTIDLHWRLNNAWWLASVTDFDRLSKKWIEMPALGDHARAPCMEHSLMIACLHRAAHMPYLSWQRGDFRRMESDLSLWIYDLHLLADRISSWDEIVMLVTHARLAHIMLDGLNIATARHGTGIPAGVIQQLRNARNQIAPSRVTATSSTLLTLQALPDWRSRVRWLVQQLFPSRDYMRRHHGADSPGRYLRRIIGGLRIRRP